jgi:cellulose synthase (UDP-forming)
MRLASIALAVSSLWYGQWMIASIDLTSAWIALPFAVASLLAILVSLVTVVNNWRRIAPPERLVRRGAEPTIAVIIPTCGEPVDMVASTAESVVGQDWPSERLVLVLSDDAHRPEIASMAKLLQQRWQRTVVLYHQPPPVGSTLRRGNAKAGNLNSALALVDKQFPTIAWVETRDADDMVGDQRFLRQCVGQFVADNRLAFVQTIKEAQVGAGDPFNNLESIFYRELMLARNATNSVFPCGSGLVWRRAALHAIGGFPTWNLVEDLQSGVEALRRGWRGLFIPIVGAVAQHAPHDLPNVYKQRGTWALDTLRLLFWGDLRGLSPRQRLHFAEMGLFYVLSLALLVFMTVPLISLVFRVYPLVTDSLTYAAHFGPFMAAMEWYLMMWRGQQPYAALWRARQLWLGLVPVYASVCLIALFGGPNRKPTYTVTRKVDHIGWHWRETLVHMTLAAVLLAALLRNLTSRASTWDAAAALDLGSAVWACVFIVGLASFVQKGWYRADPGKPHVGISTVS